MSNQLVITSGAKVRSLNGVITGTTGVLDSLPINAANGIPQLDSSGKILVSQLPNSVMEYKGTWNAATNTPTLADGTGNQGDVYLCNVAGTVNFGSGPIAFVVGDQVIYSGTIWQRASGATGTVTSVAVTESGDALSITGSPITTSGTINIGFAGSSAQYVAGDGSLVTFPTIISEAQNLITDVYNETGATLTKGTVVYINGGHGNLPTVTKAIATNDATSAQTYGVVQADITNNNNGHVVVIGTLGDLDTQAYAAGTQLYLSSTTAGAWTSTKQYAPAHLVYVGIVVRSHPTQGIVEVRIQNGFELDELHNVSAQSPSNNDGLFYNSSTSLWENKSIATALGYTPADDSLVVKLAGNQTITGVKTFSTQQKFDLGLAIKEGTSGTLTGYTVLGANVNQLLVGVVGATQTLTFPSSSSYTYTFPSATGTLALTSDLSSYVPTSRTISTTSPLSGGGDLSGNLTLSISQASGSTNGYLSSTDWTTFNNKQNALTNPVTGTGTTNYLPKFTGTSAIGNSLVYDNGSSVGINTTSPVTVLDVYGDASFGSSSKVYVGSDTTGGYIQVATSAKPLRFFTPTSEAMRISSDANVGIGTSSPSSPLDVVASNSTAINLRLRGRAADSVGQMEFWNNAQSTRYGYIATDSTAMSIASTQAIPLIFGTNSTTRLTIASTGAATFSSSVTAGDNGNIGLILRRGTTTDRFKLFVGSGTPYIADDNYISSLNTDLHFLAGGSGTTEIVTFKLGGNVGIGTSSPTSPLHVGTATSGNQKIQQWGEPGFIDNYGLILRGSSLDGVFKFYGLNNGTETSAPILSMNRSSGNVGIGTTSPTTYSLSGRHLELNDAGGGYAFYHCNTTNVKSFFATNESAGLSALFTFSNHPLTFGTNNTERMRIFSNGSVSIGSTSAIGRFLVQGATSNNADYTMILKNSSAADLFVVRNDGAIITGTQSASPYNLTVATAANLYVDSYGYFYRAISSRKYKTDIIDYDRGLNELLNLRPVFYKGISNHDGDTQYAGLIAEEVHELGLTEFVQYADDGSPDALSYSNMVALLVKAIQEQQQQIEELKAKIK